METTRIITMEITIIDKTNNVIAKGKTADRLKAHILRSTNADDVVVTRVQDFVMGDDKPCDKTSPYRVAITGHNNAIGCEVGNCRCGNLVRSIHKYCFECGQRLEW